MLFGLSPKVDRRELFGRDAELEFIKAQIVAGNWVIVAGQRMMGKTSLVRVALSELGREGFRSIYVNLMGIKSLRGLLQRLEEAWRGALGGIDASINLSLGPFQVDLRRRADRSNLLGFLLGINENAVIAMDEVQELAPATPHLLRVLGNVFASNPRVRFIFTGSYMGLMKMLLDSGPDSPLYGRPPVEVRLRPFTVDQSTAFLSRGFEELGISFKNHEEVVERLDGVVGWLTLFGNYHGVRGLELGDALKRAVEEGEKIIRSELAHFLEGRDADLHLAVLEAAKRESRWSGIKRGAEIILGRRLDDRTITNALNALVEGNIIEKTADGYRIADPIMRNMDFWTARQ
ncbi:hypothetical protein GCM10007981_01260 [Thermocladium modestius]|uniref:ATPase domain-containing protein n=1 Tax=Thermocladium modestius TaxID=62609 RepID=A0A830GSC9_9CREN|nr:ATP-binding protein [Thermocladium modestius]GGP19069.1 hypothetical protein GCM10007981_01260 [Thermocladium modestius]